MWVLLTIKTECKASNYSVVIQNYLPLKAIILQYYTPDFNINSFAQAAQGCRIIVLHMPNSNSVASPLLFSPALQSTISHLDPNLWDKIWCVIVPHAFERRLVVFVTTTGPDGMPPLSGDTPPHNGHHVFGLYPELHSAVAVLFSALSGINGGTVRTA